ncbi:MAG: hypothetical protein P4L41_06580 [Flavipsychrobacter sp.]|nr:hypothetical protein [Flavipsychrobacter sp.]
MKKLIYVTCIAISLFSSASAQQLSYETLKLNSSPGFTVLGVDPVNIQRPNSPTDFIAGAQSAIVNDKLQPNFALETTPYYWKHLKNTDSLRVEPFEYLQKKNFRKTIAESFTLSFATSSSDTFTFGKLNQGTGLGFGARIILASGKLSKKTSTLLQNYYYTQAPIHQAYQNIILAIQTHETTSVDVDEILDDWKNRYQGPLATTAMDVAGSAIKAAIGKETVTQQDIAAIQTLDNIVISRQAAILQSVNAAKVPLTREGFMLELAAADAVIVQNNEWKSTANAKGMIWLTPSWRINTRPQQNATVIDYLDIMAVARLTLNNQMADSSNYFDGGVQLQYTHNKISISSEYVLRVLTDKPETVKSNSTWRADFSLDYKINAFVTFKITLGSNFDGNSIHYSDPKKIFALGGFNFGFSNFIKNSN